MSLEGFTSSSSGDQLFTLSGSVEGTYTGVLSLMGEHLDLLDFITVSGQQYTDVTFGDLQKTESVVMVPVEIVSTANGGAMIQVGDAVITLAVTYVAPVPVISSVIINGAVATDYGGNWLVIADRDVSYVNDMVGVDFTTIIYINGQNLLGGELWTPAQCFFYRPGTGYISSVQSMTVASQTTESKISGSIRCIVPSLNAGITLQSDDRLRCNCNVIGIDGVRSVQFDYRVI